MAALGMLALGSFIGWVTSYGLTNAEDWKNPGNVLSAVISGAVAGGIFAFISWIQHNIGLGSAIFFYPVGLAYGAFCNSLGFIANYYGEYLKWLHLAAFAIATILVLALLCPWIQRQLTVLPGGGSPPSDVHHQSASAAGSQSER